MNHVLWLCRAAQLQLIIQSIFKTSCSHKAEGFKFKVNFSQIYVTAASNAGRFMIHELFHVKKRKKKKRRQITDSFLWHLIQKSLFLLIWASCIKCSSLLLHKHESAAPCCCCLPLWNVYFRSKSGSVYISTSSNNNQKKSIGAWWIFIWNKLWIISSVAVKIRSKNY